MRSNRLRAHGRSTLSLTRNFNASNVDGFTKSAISSVTHTQRFGNNWHVTGSRTGGWHITTECGNITGAGGCVFVARLACAASSRAHGVRPDLLSRTEWRRARQTRRRRPAVRACPGATRPRTAPPCPVRHPRTPATYPNRFLLTAYHTPRYHATPDHQQSPSFTEWQQRGRTVRNFSQLKSLCKLCLK